MGIGPGLAAFKLSFQICPIFLTGGVAGLIPGGVLPIITMTESLNFTTGLLSGSADVDLDSFFANFRPVGATLINQKIATYPFANQNTAANAVIAQPLGVSFLMVVPVKQTAGYAIKLATMMALQATLAQHNNSGGTYTLATPSYFYTNCLMDGPMRDVTPADSKQAQTVWQIDFAQPLITLNQAQQAQNSMMSKISGGVPTDGALSGLGQTVGSPPSLATPSLVPAASNPAGAGVAGPVLGW